MRSTVASVLATVVLGLLLLLPRGARAQQCHGWSGTWRTPGLTLGLRLDAAGYYNTSYEGDYQGIAPTLAWSHRRISIQAMLPAYRIVRNGLTEVGLGDLLLAARAPIPGWSHHGLTAGLGFAATFPTGNADDDLGMGHVMLMPEFWWTLQRGHGRILYFGTVGYGRAVGGNAGGAHAHHQANRPTPIVNPMNLSEIDASIGAQFQVHRWIWLTFSAFGATPAGNGAHGITRAIASPGVLLSLQRFDLSAELQAPITGLPFLARGVVEARYRFALGRRHPRR